MGLNHNTKAQGMWKIKKVYCVLPFFLLVVWDLLACLYYGNSDLEFVKGDYYAGYLTYNNKVIVDHSVVDYKHSENLVYGVKMPSYRAPCQRLSSRVIVKNESVYFFYDTKSAEYKEFSGEGELYGVLAKRLTGGAKKLEDTSTKYWQHFYEWEAQFGSAKKDGCHIGKGGAPVLY